MSTTATMAPPAPKTEVSERKKIWQVISASSVGTMIEWYDFYIFGSLATIISAQFFPKDNPTAAFLATLATFAAGFVVRPFGALVFGRLGDMIGRKYTFLLTLILMGGSTFAIGLVPSYETIGFAAPMTVLMLRLMQGLALGGEYGGAATYVAEHSPNNRRGYYTSWIQTTATLGLFVSLGVILATRSMLGVEKFASWGWRIPFLVSLALVIVSIYIRMRMEESPVFAKAKSEGRTTKNPIKESFAKKDNLRMVLLALFGAVMGQGVVWYTGQFYAMSFIETVCKVDFVQTRNILLIALALATPFFILFGSLSDRIGRKWIMLLGMGLAILTYRPIYRYMLNITSDKTYTVVDTQSSTSTEADKNGVDKVETTKTVTTFDNGMVKTETKKQKVLADANAPAPKAEVKTERKIPGGVYWTLIFLVFIQVVYVTMVYGPIAAFLVELFPTRIRYTSMSLPYHVGNGVFGGLVPFIATRLVDATRPAADAPPGDPLAGLWYPIIIASVCFVVGAIYMTNKADYDVHH